MHVDAGKEVVIEGSPNEVLNGIHKIKERLNSNTVTFKTEAEDTHDEPHLGGTIKVKDSGKKKKVKFDKRKTLGYRKNTSSI